MPATPPLADIRQRTTITRLSARFILYLLTQNQPDDCIPIDFSPQFYCAMLPIVSSTTICQTTIVFHSTYHRFTSKTSGVFLPSLFNSFQMRFHEPSLPFAKASFCHAAWFCLEIAASPHLTRLQLWQSSRFLASLCMSFVSTAMDILIISIIFIKLACLPFVCSR